MIFTGERFVPTEHGEIRLEHYHRYAVALGLTAHKDVLDVACGEGYGSSMMAAVARSVVGVDVSSEAVDNARAVYHEQNNLTFLEGRADSLDFPDASFDVVVSFETIEHLAEQSEMLSEIHRVLRSDGILVISSPNRPVYSEMHESRNEFHVKELDFDEFDGLLKTKFRCVNYFGQRLVMASVIQPLHEERSDFQAWYDDGNALIPRAAPMTEAVYFVAICAKSEGDMPYLPASVLQPKHLDLLKQYVGYAKWAQIIEHEFLTCRNTIAARDKHIAILEKQVNEILTSRSWKIVSLLRSLARRLRFLYREPHAAMLSLMRKVYHSLPVSAVQRNRIKGWFYTRFPSIFSRTLSYSLWKTQAVSAELRSIVYDVPETIGAGFEIQSHENPLVSIVIPVYGKIAYTYHCLLSLWSHYSKYSFEIIVVDDNSPDNTSDVLKTIGGIRLVRNQENLGFIRSCNEGARHAKGRLLVMLNNDTVVRPGWLDELVDTFNCIPGAGLVGSKLLYPDGRLQEAGGVIWKDGSGWNYGRLEDPNHPRFSYLRDVDYCSGASLMIPASLYDRLGGFDEHYLPAYGEDSDLAFKVRQAGYRVLYQPLSEAVHFEGITSGKDVSSGVKAYQNENAKKLYTRWASAMEAHNEPGELPDIAKDRNVTGRVLVLDHCTPTPDQDAGSITAVNLMRILQGLGFKVTFAPEDNFLYLDPYTRDLQRIGIECLYSPYVTSVEQHLADCGSQYDVVIVFRLLAAERNVPLIRKFCPNAKIVFHTSDLHYLREMREAELADSELLRAAAARTRDRELSLIRTVDATIVHSTHEKTMLDQELDFTEQNSSVFLFGWAIEIPGTRVPFDARNGLVFVGGFQHQPNVDAVVYFAQEIFPIVRQVLPDAIFRIIGSRATPEVTALAGDGVEVLGYVEDLGSILDRARMSVVPLRYGAGIKGKIGTSLCHGLPCVSTTIGAEGMGLVEGDGVIIADDPASFAKAVIDLYENRSRWESSSIGGMEFVHRNYSLDAGVGIMESLLRNIGLSSDRFVKRPLTSLHCLGSVVDDEYPADQIDDYRILERDVHTREQYADWISGSEVNVCREREGAIVRMHGSSESFTLPGFCRVCDRNVDFLVDRQCGAEEVGGLWLPNWRERMVCSCCGLNNRQRAIAYAARSIVMSRRDRRADVYLMEQVTPIYQWMAGSVSQATCTGSEYLGDDIPAGKVIKGIRHEDVERLSFSDESFDLIISNDVLEHVVRPMEALKEASRVLRPKGVLLMTVPFYLDAQKSIQRADVRDGQPIHFLPPVYHGNPVSDEGSLVFTDFGWDFVGDIRQAGFADVRLHFYWSEVYGHLGLGQHYIYAAKS